jgi:hypothetical protein
MVSVVAHVGLGERSGRGLPGYMPTEVVGCDGLRGVAARGAPCAWEIVCLGGGRQRLHRQITMRDSISRFWSMRIRQNRDLDRLGVCRRGPKSEAAADQLPSTPRPARELLRTASGIPGGAQIIRDSETRQFYSMAVAYYKKDGTDALVPPLEWDGVRAVRRGDTRTWGTVEVNRTMAPAKK